MFASSLIAASRPGAATVDDFAAGTSPRLGPPASFQSWSDCRRVLSTRRIFLRASPWTDDSTLLRSRHECGASWQMDRFSLSRRDGVRMGPQLALDETAAAAMAAVVLARTRGR